MKVVHWRILLLLDLQALENSVQHIVVPPAACAAPFGANFPVRILWVIPIYLVILSIGVGLLVLK